MKRVRWLSGLLSMGMLSLTLVTVGSQVVLAQKPIRIFDLKCVGTSHDGYSYQLNDISIGRELYTSSLTLVKGSWTCQLPGGPASLRIEYGVPDNSQKPPAQIDVYVDGNQVASHVGKEGRVNTMMVDVSNGKSLAFDISCSRATNCNDQYYFFWFHLMQGATSPGSR